MNRFLILLVAFFTCFNAVPCTSAIVSGRFTVNGRPILWKHRDTSDLNNKVERIESESGFDYVALFNQSDTLSEQAWIGFNEVGFAIMNTASYNLKADSVKEMDKEGLVMAKALETCRTVDDFESFLKREQKPLGVEANFGVIDANGSAAYFETCNFDFKRIDVDSVVVRTNYSHTGRVDEGYGYIREATAELLLKPYVVTRSLTPSVFTEILSRSFYHSLMGQDFALCGLEYIVDRDFIPRRISSASVAIEGVTPSDNPLMTTMWSVLGYPPCGVVRPVWIFEGGIPKEVVSTKGELAPDVRNANKLKEQVFDFSRDNGNNYLRIGKLFKKDGTGISQINNRKSIDNYKSGYEILKRKFAK